METYLPFFYTDTNILEMDIFPRGLQNGFNISHSVVLQDMQCCGSTSARMHAVPVYHISHHCLLLHIMLWLISNNCPTLLSKASQIGNKEPKGGICTFNSLSSFC